MNAVSDRFKKKRSDRIKVESEDMYRYHSRSVGFLYIDILLKSEEFAEVSVAKFHCDRIAGSRCKIGNDKEAVCIVDFCSCNGTDEAGTDLTVDPPAQYIYQYSLQYRRHKNVERENKGECKTDIVDHDGKQRHFYRT